MRFNNTQVLSITSSASGGASGGSYIDANQICAASFQILPSNTNPTGTFKIQASNEPIAVLPAGEGPQNWTDIPSASGAVTSGGSFIILVPVVSFRWMRAYWSHTSGGTANIAAYMDAISYNK